MWVFLNDSMLSIVAHRDRPEMLLVRARAVGDIPHVFGEHTRVEFTPENDYPYRAMIHRKTVARIVGERLECIDYGNFKASVKDRRRHDAYLGVWTEMRRWQEALRGVRSAMLSLGARGRNRSPLGF